MKEFKMKHKIAEEERQKLKQVILPKMNDTKKVQKEIREELEKIKGDAELLPSMFRAEAVFRNQCKKERDDALFEKDKAM